MMAQGQHTPGPWEVQTPFSPDGYSIVQAGLKAYEWQFIAQVDVGIPAEGMFPRQEARANARLIAAAPEMLAALDHIGGLSRALRQGGPDPMDLQDLSDALNEAVDLANSMVTKAEGRS